MWRWIALMMLWCVAGCESSTTNPDRGFTLDLKRIMAGEELSLKLLNIDGISARVFLGEVELSPNYRSSTLIKLTTPSELVSGDYLIGLKSDQQSYQAPVLVFARANVDPNVVVTLLKEGTNLQNFEAWLNARGLSLGEVRDLGGEAACGNLLVEIELSGVSLGQALAELEANEVVLGVDPRTSYDLGALSAQSTSSLDYQTAVSSHKAHARGFTGKGMRIAVIDTGVNAHPELAGRLLAGFNALEGSSDTSDRFDNSLTELSPDGHGTAVAVFAAGSLSGIAPEAQILPIKACGDAGQCLSSDVIKGICYALNHQPQHNDKLIINLSLGGPVPIDILKGVLAYALEQGARVVAAAGNEGEHGSPTHYPAAFELAGLIAVGAAQPISPQAQVCADFASLTAAELEAGAIFREAWLEFSFRVLTTPSGESLPRGRARRLASSQSGGQSPELDLENLQLHVALPQGVTKVSFALSSPIREDSILDFGVNDDFALNQVLIDLIGFRGVDLGNGVKASLELNLVEENALVTLEGNITSFHLGSQNLRLDDVCFEGPSLGETWTVSSFSTQGSYVDLVAPGAGLRGAMPDGSYGEGYEGTSFAAPMVSGALALWSEAHGELGGLELSQQLIAASNPSLFTSQDPRAIGAGLLDLIALP
jgi:subtilisin